MLLCCAAEAEANTAVLYSMLGSIDSDEDEDEARGKKPGRGAPGIKRGKGKFYGHPDTPPVAKDIIRMEELEEGDANYAAQHKLWRFTYRVPFPVFKVRPSVRMFVRSNVRSNVRSYARTYVRTSARSVTAVLFLILIRSYGQNAWYVTLILASLGTQDLVAVAEEMPYQKAKKDRKMGRQKVATNILVGGSLRHLGKGFGFEGSVCNECYVGSSLLLEFHHEFMKALGGVESDFYKRHVP